RFAKRALSYDERNTTLKNLVQTYLATFNDLGVETWLMHGSLLGWWWGKQVLPWDLTIRTQVSEPDIFFLAAYHNMSTFSFKSPDRPKSNRRRYLLELSPYAKDREQADPLHPADARWIDTETGLSIDVYAVRYNLTHPGGEGMLSCKDGSEIMDTYLFPLRNTTFEGVPAKIPYRYQELLAMEYGAGALTETGQHDHWFDEDKMQWVLKEEPKLPNTAALDGNEMTGDGARDAEL
ncbi:LicD family-domain-containing protein, partial [Parachaetomium inaequale]